MLLPSAYISGNKDKRSKMSHHIKVNRIRINHFLLGQRRVLRKVKKETPSSKLKILEARNGVIFSSKSYGVEELAEDIN